MHVYICDICGTSMSQSPSETLTFASAGHTEPVVDLCHKCYTRIKNGIARMKQEREVRASAANQ